jgi:hypothetical protein
MSTKRTLHSCSIELASRSPFVKHPAGEGVQVRRQSAVTPNPSLNTPTRYGRQRKPGLSHFIIVSVQAYAAYLRGRG